MQKKSRLIPFKKQVYFLPKLDLFPRLNQVFTYLCNSTHRCLVEGNTNVWRSFERSSFGSFGTKETSFFAKSRCKPFRFSINRNICYYCAKVVFIVISTYQKTGYLFQQNNTRLRWTRLLNETTMEACIFSRMNSWLLFKVVQAVLLSEQSKISSIINLNTNWKVLL